MTETIDNQLIAKLKQLRTKRHLQAAPDMVAHILTLVKPGIGGQGGDKVSGTRETPLPLNAQALEDANNLYAQLVNWAISHARALGVLPPSVALGWHRRDEDCDGFPSWAKISDAAALTNDIADWLVMGADKIEDLPAAGDYHEDIQTIFGPMLGRYQRAPRRRTTSAETCDVCGRVTVVVNFTDDGTDATVACTYCGHVIPPTAYERYLAKVLTVLAEERAGEESDWWSVDDAVEFGEVSRATVRRYIRDGLTVYGRPFGEYLSRVEFLAAKRQRLARHADTRFTSQ